MILSTGRNTDIKGMDLSDYFLYETIIVIEASIMHDNKADKSGRRLNGIKKH